jgi:hypothetical protein
MIACFFNSPNIFKALIDAKADLIIIKKNNERKDAAALCGKMLMDAKLFFKQINKCNCY